MTEILRLPVRDSGEPRAKTEVTPKLLRRRLRNSQIMAAVLLVPALPIIALAAILVRVTSKGSPFYSQERVGLHGRRFTLYKIRSMVIDAERETGAIWARSGDPRVTLVGRFLRVTHLDELPQLFNILKGDMCINGPRPERPEFVDELMHVVPRYEERLNVHPGVTGLAQVQAPADSDVASVRNKLSLDLAYIGNLRTERGLDARILAATAFKLFAIPQNVAARLLGLDRIDRAEIPQQRDAPSRKAA